MKKVKKFGRGGDIVTGIGAALLGKALYDKYNEKKGDSEKNNAIISGEESPKYDKDKLISKEVTNAQSKSAKGTIARSDERFQDATESADVRSKSDTGSTTKIKPSESYNANLNQDRTPVTSTASNISRGPKTSSQSNQSQNNQRQGTVSTTGVDAGIAAGRQGRKAESSDKPAAPALKPGESRSVGEGKSKPLPSEAERKKKKAAIAAAEDEKAQKDYEVRGPISDAIRRNARETFPYSDMGDPRGTPGMRARNADRSRAYLHEMAEKGKAREAAEAEKKRRSRPSSEEMMTQSLGGGFKRGGAVKKYASGGSVKASKMGSVKTAKPSMRSASSRADGIAIRGKTRA